jgi:hypothetical protein
MPKKDLRPILSKNSKKPITRGRLLTSSFCEPGDMRQEGGDIRQEYDKIKEGSQAGQKSPA